MVAPEDIVISPDIVPPERDSFEATRFVTVVEKLASLLIAAANSFRVSNAVGAEFTRFATVSSTYCLVEASLALTGADKLTIL